MLGLLSTDELVSQLDLLAKKRNKQLTPNNSLTRMWEQTMMILKNFFRCGVRMLITGAALHGLSQMSWSQDVESAEFQTSNVSQGKQVSLVSDEKAPAPPTEDAPGRVQSQGPAGVARVPGCTSIGCANGACGPNGCTSGGGWGANGSPSCRANGGRGQAVGAYTFNDAGQACRGAGRSVGNAFGSVMPSQQCDWNDEVGNGACKQHGCRNCPHCCGWLGDQWAQFNARNRQQGEILRAHCHGKMAYFHPMGNGGEGVPPFGCYHLVYAVDPGYSDPRDSQIYAAQGYGVPIAVPLAPTVRHTMNYSAGIPASRLTPISNVVPPRGGRGW